MLLLLRGRLTHSVALVSLSSGSTAVAGALLYLRLVVSLEVLGNGPQMRSVPLLHREGCIQHGDIGGTPATVVVLPCVQIPELEPCLPVGR